MAERRMFTKKITDSDAFIKMSAASQALYMHLNQGADDDGFTDQIAQAMFKAHASQDDFQVLLAKRFVVMFESGVIVIKHWRMHNLIRKDRYTPTTYTRERALLVIKENGIYTEKHRQLDAGAPLGNQMATEWQPNDNQRLPQDRIGKDSEGKDRIGYTTTTTISFLEGAGAGAPMREEKETERAGEEISPPSASEVYVYMRDELGEDVTCGEAEKFTAWNEKFGWDCLPNWKGAARLWCARRAERGK